MSNVYSIFSDALHINETTGCYLWDGDLKQGEPTAEFLGTKVRIRDMILREGGQDPKAFTVEMLCENPKCVFAKHMEVKPKAAEEIKTVDVAYNEDELESVRLLALAGFKQEVIAEKMETSRSRIAKMIRVLKDRQANSIESHL